jgi:N-acetylglucosamine kinase-like BadF-type ATPase
MEALHLGVDAGNSKTVALLCDVEGRVVGYGRSGNGDIYGAESAQAATDSVVGAVKEALTVAGATAEQVSAAAFRLAGVDWPEDRAYWVEALATRLPEITRCSILNDGFAAIRGGEPSGVGVAVVAGTGSAVAGRGPRGDEWSMSFWIQDAHGASGLVASALRSVYRAALGLGPATTLTDRLLRFFGYPDVESMLHDFTRREGPRRAFGFHASAAREVVAAAVEGDEVASELARAEGEHLADYARVTARMVGFPLTDRGVSRDGEGVPVVLAGPVLGSEGSPVMASVLAALPVRFPAARPVRAVLPPVSGATLDALADAGVDITPGVLDRLRESAPPPDFLAT